MTESVSPARFIGAKSSSLYPGCNARYARAKQLDQLLEGGDHGPVLGIWWDELVLLQEQREPVPVCLHLPNLFIRLPPPRNDRF